MPSHRVIAVDVPDVVPVATAEVASLPDDWRRTPPPPALQQIGGTWLEAAHSAVLRVPSAIVPIEFNYLLNPRHPAFADLRIQEPEWFDIDKRLLAGGTIRVSST